MRAYIMDYKTAIPMIRTSVLISPEFYEQCKTMHIKFSEAMRVGISLILAERGVRDYDNDLNICRKTSQIRTKLEEVSNELQQLKDKTNSNATG
jgi:hypothetical protein